MDYYRVFSIYNIDQTTIEEVVEKVYIVNEFYKNFGAAAMDGHRRKPLSCSGRSD